MKIETGKAVGLNKNNAKGRTGKDQLLSSKEIQDEFQAGLQAGDQGHQIAALADEEQVVSDVQGYVAGSGDMIEVLPAEGDSPIYLAAAETGATAAAAGGSAGAATTAAVATTATMSAGTMLVIGAGVVGVAAAAGGGGGGTAAPAPVADTVAPLAPTVALTTDSGVAADLITNVGTLNITPAEVGGIVEYSTDGGLTWVDNAVTPFAGVEGLNTVDVRQTDVAGNVGAVTTLSFTLDTLLPGFTAAVGGDIYVNIAEKAIATALDITPVDATATTVSAVTVSGMAAVGGNLVVTAAAPVAPATSWTFDSSAFADGVLTVTATLTDAAGNASTTVQSITLDTVAPVAPTVALTTDSGALAVDLISNVGTLNITGVEVGALVEYSTDNGLTWVDNAVTPFAGVEGPNTVIVRQTDAAGNMGVPSAPFTFTLDTVAATFAADVGGDIFIGALEQTLTTPINFTPSEGGVTVTAVTVSGPAVAGPAGTLTNVPATAPVAPATAWTFDSTVFANGQLTVTATSNGQLTVTATLTDTAGNISTTTQILVLDTLATTVTIDPFVGAAVDGVVNAIESTAVAISGTTDGVGPVTVTLSNGVNPPLVYLAAVTPGVAPALGTWSVAAADISGLADGLITVSANVGNLVPPAAQIFALDTVATISIDPVEGDNVVNAAELANNVVVGGTITGTTDAEAGQLVSVVLNGITYTGTVVAAVAPAVLNTWSVTVPAADYAAIVDGLYSVTADVTDVAGNVATQALAPVTVDTVAPVVAIDAIQMGDNIVNIAESTAVVITGTTDAEVGQTVTVTFADGLSPNVTTTATVVAGAAGNVWSATAADISGLIQGQVTVTANVSDVAGNPATQVNTTMTLDTVAPTLTSVVTTADALTSTNAIINIAEQGVAASLTIVGSETLASVSVTDGVTTVAATETAPLSGIWTFDTTALVAGTVTVNATDLAGNSTVIGAQLDLATPLAAGAFTVPAASTLVYEDNAAAVNTVTIDMAGSTGGVLLGGGIDTVILQNNALPATIGGIDGGLGNDTLQLSATYAVIDFAAFNGLGKPVIGGFEVVDMLTDTGANSVTLTAADVLAEASSLIGATSGLSAIVIKGDALDTATITTANWTNNGAGGFDATGAAVVGGLYTSYTDAAMGVELLIQTGITVV